MRKRINGPAELRCAAHLVRAENGCLEWDGSRTDFGHGRFTLGKGTVWILSHVYAWTQARGPVPEGLFVLHHCDNPPCCDVEHLFLGTKADNTADMMAKGRDYWSQRSHCKNGHDFSIHGRMATRSNGKSYRRCQACRALHR